MNDAIFDYHRGDAPLLVSIPHDGREVPADIAARMTAAGRALPDTDWHVARLYAFARELGASVITARCSRYVVDLNRPAGDTALYPGQVSTGLCPARTFAGAAIYAGDAGVDDDERRQRTARYWQPYHARLAAALADLRARHGHALLWDAHSIVSEVPALFDGQLPVLNIGTNRGASCAAAIERRLWNVADASGFSAVSNGRFTGGHITRHYGNPDGGVHAVQLEIAQRSYMDEKTLRYDDARAARLQSVLRQLLQTFIDSAAAEARDQGDRPRRGAT